jgi:hypothetical protein
MKTCSICNNTSFRGKSTKTGDFVCHDCMKKIPKIIQNSVLNSIDTVKAAIEYHQYYNDFEYTSSYGELYLDELHGLFKIEDAIFNIMHLSDVAFSCKNTKVNSASNVTTDIEFTCEITYPQQRTTIVRFKKMIKTSAKCVIEKSDPEYISWDPPGAFMIFRQMFFQAYDTAFDRYERKQRTLNLEDYDLAAAKILFMLTDNQSYDKNVLRSRRNNLLKAFHPDNDGDTEASEIINKAYEILLNTL